MPESDEELLTAKEVARYLKLDVQTVYRLASSGALPRIKIGGSLRFKKSVIDGWLVQQPLRKGKALVVDDDQTVREYIGVVLSSLGVEAVLAASGEAALEKMREEANAFRVVFLDLLMPGLDGVETLKRLKEISTSLLVVIITGLDQGHELITEAIKHSPVAFLSKPINRNQLKQVVDAVFAER